MKELKKFSITKRYSQISELQKESLDTYMLEQDGNDLILSYRSENENICTIEKRRICNVGFECIASLVTYLAENSARSGTWIDIAEDFCSKKSATLKAT